MVAFNNKNGILTIIRLRYMTHAFTIFHSHKQTPSAAHNTQSNDKLNVRVRVCVCVRARTERMHDVYVSAIVLHNLCTRICVDNIKKIALSTVEQQCHRDRNTECPTYYYMAFLFI